MTLTDIMPSLRRSLPDPISSDRWPTGTVPTTTDLMVGGVSLLHLTMLCGSPCLHTADAVFPGTRDRRDPGGAAVVVTTVTSVASGPSGDLLIEVDAQADALQARWSDVRLIGRASTVHTVQVHLTAADSVPLLHLPGDLRCGDLIAIPCSGHPTRATITAKDPS